MKAVLSIVLVSPGGPALQGGLRCLGTLALVLMSWGCAGQRVDVGTLPLLPIGATVEVSELPYLVRGTTVPEIGMSLRTAASEAVQSSPIDPHRSRLSVDYRYGIQGVYCEMTWIAIELKSSIQVPQWADREAADPTLVAMWDSYVLALRVHEYTHREYLFGQARDISRELYRIESTTCESMQQMATSTAARINDRYGQLNERFDEANGAITWPPWE